MTIQVPRQKPKPKEPQVSHEALAMVFLALVLVLSARACQRTHPQHGRMYGADAVLEARP